MSTGARSQSQAESFAEAALRLSGKSEEEARRTGAVDTADDQVESLFAPQYQTVNSPIHRAVWGDAVPMELFAARPENSKAKCEEAMQRCLAVVRQRRQENALYDAAGKLRSDLIAELTNAGYWGMLIDRSYGGQGAPFARFSRFLAQVATTDPTVAGLASVHGCIGAVDPVRTFGTPEQKAQFLPLLARGNRLSGFALTEPGAGSDLTALRTQAVRAGDELEITGEKLFITNAVPGRMIGLVVVLEGKPAVIIAELPEHESEAFQTVRYDLYALKHTFNNGLRFRRFRVPVANLLRPKVGDGLTIAYHGLNLGRVALCANAAGTMRILLANMLPWAEYRRTYGQPILTRELVKRRIARLAGLIAGADALVAWCSGLIDEGYRGELECVIAKIFGSEALKEAAIELFMKTHGGRSFLKGHIFGDNVYDFLAPCIYEGEGEMLGLAFFKSLVKHHGLTYFEPIGKALQRHQIRQFRPARPAHIWKLRHELGAYFRWTVGQRLRRKPRPPLEKMQPQFTEHIGYALDRFDGFPMELSSTMRKHQLKLADRQCRIAELSQRVQDAVILLVVALWGQQQANDTMKAAASLLCQDMRRKLSGERPSDAYFRSCAALADRIIETGFPGLEDAPRAEILMPYASS